MPSAHQRRKHLQTEYMKAGVIKQFVSGIYHMREAFPLHISATFFKWLVSRRFQKIFVIENFLRSISKSAALVLNEKIAERLAF